MKLNFKSFLDLLGALLSYYGSFESLSKSLSEGFELRVETPFSRSYSSGILLLKVEVFECIITS